MPTLVLIRHGQSAWNLENRFTGWTDVDLSPAGMQEAVQAGRSLLEAGYDFDLAFTSVLTRAIRTLWLVLEELDMLWLPVQRTWRLNERHYGALQGLNKAETAERYSPELVHQWRRSYATAPPPLDPDDPRHPRHDPRYRDADPATLPLTESLQDTEARLLPYWHETIAPALQAGRRPLVVAHGNSLRALVRHLDNIPADVIPDLNIPTGAPLVYELDQRLRPERHFYLEG